MSGKNFIQSAADKREAQLAQKLKALAKAGEWDAVIAEMDRFDENNERRHREHRGDLDVTIVDREMRCSVRNVTKRRQKAIETVRLLVTGHKELRKQKSQSRILRLWMKDDIVITRITQEG